jgi:dTDP-4-dehydrorhamnose reductase
LKGLFHLGGPEKASRFQFAEKLCATLRVSGSLIEKTRLADSASPAARPPDCSLNSNKIKKALNLISSDLTGARSTLCQADPEGSLPVFVHSSKHKSRHRACQVFTIRF